MNPTPANLVLLAGFRQSLALNGRTLSVIPNNSRVTGLVEDVQPLVDPMGENIAQAETPVYARVSVEARSIAAPRAVTGFTIDGEYYQAIRFEASPGNTWSWSWLCWAPKTR